MLSNLRTVLAVVCVSSCTRSARRLLSGKLKGKPILDWTLSAVANSRAVDRLVVSTTNSDIASFAKSRGIETIIRDDERLAAHGSRLASIATLHALNNEIGLLPDYVVAINSEAPLLRAGDIDCGLDVCHEIGGLPMAAVTEMHLSLENIFRIEAERRLMPLFESFPKKADGQKLYASSNSLYFASSRYLLEQNSFLTSDTRAFILPFERSWSVGSKEDLMVAEGLLQRTI